MANIFNIQDTIDKYKRRNAPTIITPEARQRAAADPWAKYVAPGAATPMTLANDLNGGAANTYDQTTAFPRTAAANSSGLLGQIGAGIGGVPGMIAGTIIGSAVKKGIPDRSSIFSSVQGAIDAANAPAAGEATKTEANTLLTSLNNASNADLRGVFKSNRALIADEMQRRGVQNTGIHEQSLNEAAAAMSRQASIAHEGNALEVWKGLNQVEQSNLNRAFEQWKAQQGIKAQSKQDKMQLAATFGAWLFDQQNKLPGTGSGVSKGLGGVK